MAKNRVLVVALAVAALTPFGGCAGDETKNVPTSECASGTKWVGGNEGSERMHPGRDCVGCHASNDGPSFTLAGTIYAADGQADECFGTGGVTVEITDANGAVTTLSANEAGNFYTKAGIAMPFTAKVRSAAGERVMATPQSNGDCNTCHAPQGRNGAPGRILAP